LRWCPSLASSSVRRFGRMRAHTEAIPLSRHSLRSVLEGGARQGRPQSCAGSRTEKMAAGAPAALKIQCPHDQRPDLREVTQMACDGTHGVFMVDKSSISAILLNFCATILR